MNRGDVWWHTTNPHNFIAKEMPPRAVCSSSPPLLMITAITSDAMDPMFAMYCAWHPCGARSVEPTKHSGCDSPGSWMTLTGVAWQSAIIRTRFCRNRNRDACGISVAG
uniref:Phyb2 n=1 Tax=Arundo donax TaxID=35708 RepID=A0A0A9DJK7_ARUDO